MNTPASPTGPTIFRQGSPGYDAATSPDNTCAEQTPAAVVRPATSDDAVRGVLLAIAEGWTIVPQATGHGAAGRLGDDVLLVDTSGLDGVEIDAESKIARVGAGATWAAVNARAADHGLLGLAGTAPSVGVSGYTFGGGVGWFVRPHGLAAGRLRSVEYVDGMGELRTASTDARADLDRDALWAFRGGQGVGLATSLEFELVDAPDLWAGLLLWPIAELGEVADAWVAALSRIGVGLDTCLAVTTAPSDAFVPSELRGRPVVHLSLASLDGAASADPLFAILAAAPAPAVNTWGPSDVGRLGTVHLDPPSGTPAYGVGRWLTGATMGLVSSILGSVADGTSPVSTVELRYVENDAPVVDGALTRVAGAFLLHATGTADDDDARAALDDALDAVVRLAAPADTGLGVVAFAAGHADAGRVFDEATAARVASVRAAVDPGGRFRSGRTISR